MPESVKVGLLAVVVTLYILIFATYLKEHNHDPGEEHTIQ